MGSLGGRTCPVVSVIRMTPLFPNPMGQPGKAPPPWLTGPFPFSIRLRSRARLPLGGWLLIAEPFPALASSVLVGFSGGLGLLRLGIN